LELSRQNAKKKMLGNVKFIGELGRLDLLSEAILHKCIKTLLDKPRDKKYSDMSENLECLCKMMPSIGKKLDQGESIKLMDQYFERMRKLRSLGSTKINEKDTGLPTRIKFLLQDCIDLRANNWVPRQTQIDQAPKTMTEVRNGAFMEEMAAAQAMASSKEAQEAAAAANFSISSSYLHTNIPLTGRSSLMMNMYQTLSQQPNMSLLNAISGISNQKNINKKFPQSNDLGGYKILAENASEEFSNSFPVKNNIKDTYTNENFQNENNMIKYPPQRISKFNSPKVGYNDHMNNSFEKNKINRESYDMHDSNENINNRLHKPFLNSSKIQEPTEAVNNLFSNKINFSNQNTQSFNIQSQENNNFTNINPISSNSNDQQPPTETLNLAQLINKRMIMSPEIENNKIKNESHTENIKEITRHNKKFLKNNYSTNMNPTEEYLNLSYNYNQNQQNKNIKNNNFSNKNNNPNNDIGMINNKIKNPNPGYNNRNYNTANRIENISPNNFNENGINSEDKYLNNNYKNGQSRNLLAKNALGVSKDEVLPLNKQIIPLEKIIKYDHKHLKLKNNHAAQNNNSYMQNNSNDSNFQVSKGNQFNGVNNNENSKNHRSAIIENRNTLNEELNKKVTCFINSYLSDINSDENIKPESDYLIDNNLVKEIIHKMASIFKSFKFTNEQMSESIRIIIAFSLSKSDFDRYNISKLFAEFFKIEGLTTETKSSSIISTEIFLNSFKVILNNLVNLESEFHLVKSYVSLYAARSIFDNIISFGDLANLLKNGSYYPLFFLCMQNLRKLKSPEWLRVQLEKYRINLIEMLPGKVKFNIKRNYYFLNKFLPFKLVIKTKKDLSKYWKIEN
jgi:hypothetical protein